MALSIIAMVDEEYEVALKGDDIRTANTLEDLFNIVKSKNNFDGLFIHTQCSHNGISACVPKQEEFCSEFPLFSKEESLNFSKTTA